ncbi:MAG: hypothetical protein ACI9VR_001562 [Cognaticolwellia sp.]|jgi:hypothetical protein
MLALAFLTNVASAAEPAYYSPDAVAGASSTFARFAEVAAPHFETLQTDLAKSAKSIDVLDTSVNLLGTRVTPELTTYRDGLRRALTKGYMQAQAHVGWFEDASTSIFTQALERELKALEGQYELSVCRARTGMSAITGPGASMKQCDGADLNPQLALALDSSKALTDVVDQLTSEPWPFVQVQGSEQPVLPWLGSDDYINLALVDRALSKRMKDFNQALDDELLPLEDDLADTKTDQGKAALAKADALRQSYEADVAAWGNTLLGLIEKPLDKKGLEVGLCANPESLGGCVGTDRTDRAIEILKADKKVQKTLSAL